jgi:hypothetical protein
MRVLGEEVVRFNAHIAWASSVHLPLRALRRSWTRAEPSEQSRKRLSGPPGAFILDTKPGSSDAAVGLGLLETSNLLRSDQIEHGFSSGTFGQICAFGSQFCEAKAAMYGRGRSLDDLTLILRHPGMAPAWLLGPLPTPTASSRSVR